MEVPADDGVVVGEDAVVAADDEGDDAELEGAAYAACVAAVVDVGDDGGGVAVAGCVDDEDAADAVAPLHPSSLASLPGVLEQ